MNLTGLLELLRSEPRYQELCRRLTDTGSASSDAPLLSLGMLEATRPYLLTALQLDWPGSILVVSGTPESARTLAEQLHAWTQRPKEIHYFPAPDVIFYDHTSWDREALQQRASILSALTQMRSGTRPSQGNIVIASAWSLMTKSVPPSAIKRALRTLQAGQRISPQELLEYLATSGYEYSTVVEEPGTYSRRGSILDIYIPRMSMPLRLDFWGDEIESLRWFDPSTQRSAESAQQVTLVPASEALPAWGKAAAAALDAIDLSSCNQVTRQHLAEEIAGVQEGRYTTALSYYLPYLYPRPGNLIDFLPDGTLVLIDDLVGLRSAALALENQALSLRTEMIGEGTLPANWATPYIGWEELHAQLDAHRTHNLGFDAHDTTPFFGERSFIAVPQFAGQLRYALADITELARSERVVIVTRQAERLADLIREDNHLVSPVTDLFQPPEPGTITLIDGIVGEGWAYTPQHLVLLTDVEIFGWARPRKRRTLRESRISPDTFFSDLREGDYVVHLEHGIGKFHGMVHKTIGSLEREYLELEYAAGDRLFVPIHQTDRVGRYVGPDDQAPELHRLGSSEWATARARAQRAVRDIAFELLELYAAREIAPGHSFTPDTTWQHELESSFPYEETPDQLRALGEVKLDMEKPKPMDRLLCGDVGYGKTEVALRAAFKAVMDGKQVAVLVPTTILAQQHYYTFRRRLRAFPVTVDMLSRFRSPAEQTEILDALAGGRVDIVIGTHRLLSRDVAFKDLGLLIIDEEQRFGVSHKEKLKQLRHEIDVLTLTATPIPRTLYLALSGARDMSVIDTPPQDRLPVRTMVAPNEPALVRKAILRELDRGGQVYYVHNRVQDIYAVADELQELVPEASITIGHGQMNESELAQVMLGFAQGEHNVLLCTTIIESGLDITNVNTIIIDRADTFGLAQLYQLRGRVGRGINRAYAYLFYNPLKPLSEIARRRLQTIQEATELGAGFRVAMQDMEIRGAGEVLGAEQHGHIAAIGYDLYVRLLQQAVQELRAASGDSMQAIRRAQQRLATEVLTLELGPSVDLPLSSYLPDQYMTDNQLRLRFYRRLARVDSLAEIEELTSELADRFGGLPDPVKNLLYILRIRLLAAQSGVTAIAMEEGRVALSLTQSLPPALARQIEAIDQRLAARGGRIWLAKEEGWQEILERLLRGLGENIAYLALTGVRSFSKS
ncbi:MAG: transcription-repair coupling factor [Anaerolineae bacterium]